MSGQIYQWNGAEHPHSHTYLLPEIGRILGCRQWPKNARVLDFGSGNGALAGWLGKRGFDVVGVEPSSTGVAAAARAFPDLSFTTDTSAENLARLGPFDLAFCIEVIAHCFDPAAELKKIVDNLKPGGTLVLATPYYGYLKILALALTGKLTEHQSVASSASYVSMFTPESIGVLIRDAGAVDLTVTRIGRVPPLAKAMVVTAQKPASDI